MSRAEVAAGGHAVLLYSPKSLVILTPFEILELLRTDPQKWAEALRRGKYHKRAEATARREGAR